MKTNWKGIYLHGYQGYVTQEKKSFLDQIGEIYAPNIDYDQNPTIINDLFEQFKDQNLDFVAGTSLGGILVYHLAILLDVPCFLLNPAVTALDQIKQFIPSQAFEKEYDAKMMVITGMKDEIVSPKQQISFFEKKYSNSSQLFIIQDVNLGHFVPYDTFEDSFETFFKFIQ